MDVKTLGLDSVKVIQHNKMIKVVYGSYSSKEAAQKQLNIIAKHKLFKGVWILKLS